MIDFRWLFLSLPMKKLAKQDQLMFGAFFVTLGVNEGVPMVDLPFQVGEEAA